MNQRLMFKYTSLLTFILLASSGFGQNVKQEKMEQLSFLVGEWIGTSRQYEDGKVTKQGSAYEKISYDLDKHILVIELNSEMLQLHTIIYYSEEDSTYYYNPFYKRGAAKYRAEFKDGQLVVSPSDTKRFIFTSTEDRGFREYGEQLIDGEWVKYFEDTFTDSQ